MLPKLLASSAQETGAFRNVLGKKNQKNQGKKVEIYANCRKLQKMHKISIPLLLSKNSFSLCPPTHILSSLCDHNNNILEYDQISDLLHSGIGWFLAFFCSKEISEL